MRVTGPWNKIPKSQYDKLYYASEIPESKFMEHAHKFHTDDFGMMRYATGKYTTLEEALKNGIGIAKGMMRYVNPTTSVEAYIFQGDKQIGIVRIPGNKTTYYAEYITKNSKKYLNKDGSTFTGTVKKFEIIEAYTRILWYGQKYSDGFTTKKGFTFKANSMDDLRKQIISEYERVCNSIAAIRIYINDKYVGEIEPIHYNDWVYHSNMGKEQKINLKSGKLIK